MLETICAGDQKIALVIRSNSFDGGTHFVTSSEDALQVGFIARDKNAKIPDHRHLNVSLHHENKPRQEFVYVIKGSVLVKFYDDAKNFIVEKKLLPGDAILQFAGGHGFEFEEDSRMVEVKQGPYVNRQTDKEIF